MKAPKILPWVARRAGIGDELAMKLWRRAVGEAALIAGNRDSSGFYCLAIERLICLAEEESGRSPLSGATVTWLWRHQARIATLGLIAAENTYHLWRNNWSDFVAGQKQAA